MQLRVLPPNEWHRLKATEAEAATPYFNPEQTKVLVVEDDGKIVGTWTLMRVVHAECIWIHPEYRGVFGVAKRLLSGMRAVAQAWGASSVVTASKTPEVANLIARLGGIGPLEGASYILPVGGVRQTARALGRLFHNQIHTLVPGSEHADDPSHDEAVGHALRLAISGGDPQHACAEYNVWAASHGYAPVRYLGTHEGRIRADIMTAVVEIDDQYKVRVVEEACQ